MEEKEQFAPTEIVKDGKVTRRTFVKGAGWLTITSAIGASALGCAPAQKSESEDDKLAETGPVADPEEGFTYKSACCSVNCTSRCHLRARVKDDKIYTVIPGQMPGRDDYANCCLRSIGLGTRTHDENVRVMHPMKRTGERGSGEFEQITWEQAIDEIAERMEATKAQYGPKACGFYSFTGNLSKLSWEAPTRFAGTYGATAFDIEGIMGDHGATMGMTLCFGQGRGAHDTRDYMNSNMVVLWGRNVADTHTSPSSATCESPRKRRQDRRGGSAPVPTWRPSPISGSHQGSNRPGAGPRHDERHHQYTCTRRTGSWPTPWRPSSCASPMARCCATARARTPA